MTRDAIKSIIVGQILGALGQAVRPSRWMSFVEVYLSRRRAIRVSIMAEKRVLVAFERMRRRRR